MVADQHQPADQHRPTAEAEQIAALLARADSLPDNLPQSLKKSLTAQAETVFPLLVAAFAGRDVVGKQNAKRLLVEALPAQTRQRLPRYLDMRDPEMFSWAAATLGDLRETAVVPTLVATLADGPAKVVAASVRALITIGGPEVEERLAEFLLTHQRETILATVARMLQEEMPGICPRLSAAYPKLPAERQAWVLKFLAEAAYPQAFPLFADALAKQPMELGLFGILGLGRLHTAEAVAELQKYVNHPEWFLRKRLVEALGETGRAEAVAPLLAKLTDSSVMVRAAAVEAMTRVGHCAPNELIRALRTQDRNLKISLIRVIGQIRIRELLQPLLETLNDRDTLFFSIDAVGNLGFAEGATALLPFLRDQEWHNRLNALEALMKLAPTNLATLAQALLQDDNDMVRNAAARAIRPAPATGTATAATTAAATRDKTNHPTVNQT